MSATAEGRFDTLSPAARGIWAKSGEPLGHGLLAHMLDVAAVAERLLAREASAGLLWAARAFEMPSANAPRWLASLVGLHDIGKAIPGFQAKWPDGRHADESAGLVFPHSLRDVDRHDLASAFELQRMLSPLVGSPGRAKALAAAAAAHHGYVFDAQEVQRARRPGEPALWRAARQEIFDAYLATLVPHPSTTRTLPSLQAMAWLAGLTSIADWIGSNIEWFPAGERDATLAGHHARALEQAEEALQAIGWPCEHALLSVPAGTDDLVARIVGAPGLQARPLQQATDRLLANPTEPVLLIVEAPMGEGKTEAALLAHLRLQAALGHRGLYIGLPTQATGNAMFDRTCSFLREFGRELPLDIQLAHGGALLDDRLVELRGIHGEGGDNVRSSVWFSQRRRPLLSPYGVGTIDQALLASLNVKHHFVRLWGLANRVVVLDEVHAYDTYTSTLIEGLLRWLKALGCSVVLMSATLPRSKRTAMLRAWGESNTEPPALDYPRVIVAHGNGDTIGEHVESRPQAPIELAAVGEDLEAIADIAADLLSHGGCGAVVVNTVDRAQRLFTLLAERLSAPPMLFHARFPGDERSSREKAVLATFGKVGNNVVRPERALLVATQVVEQSLDIDFDFLISDLAPVDLLLQRAGRLHRHERERPARHRQARLVVAGLDPRGLPDLKETAWGAIYDEYILARTWAIVSREARLELPADIDRLVQAVYEGGELPAGLPAKALRFIEGRALGEHLADQQQERQRAAKAVLDARDDWADAYAGKPRGSDEGAFPGIENVTRLGPDSVTAVPVHVDAAGAWRVHPGTAPFDPAAQPDAALARQLVTRQVRLSRKEVVHSLRGQELPVAFAEHPWLRHSVPLLLRDSSFQIGKLQVHLDPILGIVYAKDETLASAPATGRKS